MNAGITRHPRYYEPIRHPAGPACPSRGSGWCVLTTDRVSRVATIPLFHACRRHYPGGTGRCPRRSLPGRWQPSPRYGRVGFRIARFEACSAFTRVAARMVARPPRRPVPSECFRPCRCLHNPLRLLPAGATVSRAGFAPARGRCLSTAHRIEGGVSGGVPVLRYAPAGAGATQDEERAGTPSGVAGFCRNVEIIPYRGLTTEYPC